MYDSPGLWWLQFVFLISFYFFFVANTGANLLNFKGQRYTSNSCWSSKKSPSHKSRLIYTQSGWNVVLQTIFLLTSAIRCCMCSCYTKRKMCWKWQTGIFTCCDLTAKEPSVKRRKLLFFIKTTFGGNHVWVRWCGRKCPENDIGRFDSHHKTFADSLDVFGSYLLEILLSSVSCSNEKQTCKSVIHGHMGTWRARGKR